MAGDWERFRAAGGGAVTERAGGGLTDWYRAKIDELRASTEYHLEQDRYDEVVRARRGGGAPPSANGAGAPWEALKSLGFNLQEMVSEERTWRDKAEQERDEAKKALYEEKADRLKADIDALRQEFREKAAGQSAPQVHAEHPKTFLERLDDFLEGKVMQRLGAVLLGEGLGSGNGQPEDPEEVVIRRLQTGNRLREALGLPPPGAGRPQVPTDGSMRADILKLLLEDDRERLHIEMDHERDSQRTRILGELKDTLKDHMGDGIDAVRDLARRSNREAAGEGRSQAAGGDGQMARAFAILCAACQREFALPQRPEPGQAITCPLCQGQVEVSG